MLASVEGAGEQPGAIRKAKGRDGREQIEQLQDIDPSEHFYRHEMVSTPMPVRDYIGTFRVRDNRDGTSTVQWSSDFAVTSEDPSKIAGMVQDFLAAGLENPKRRYH